MGFPQHSLLEYSAHGFGSEYSGLIQDHAEVIAEVDIAYEILQGIIKEVGNE